MPARRTPKTMPSTSAATLLRNWRASTGFCGADLIRRSLDEGSVEYTVLSRWESMEAIRRFAADDPSRAVVEPGAAAALLDFDDTVAHHQVVFSM